MFYWAGNLNRRPFTHADVAVDHRVFSFGGHWDSEQMDVDVFNTVSLRWVKPAPVTPGGERHPEAPPSRRRDHTAVLMDYIVYVWGGVMHGSHGFCGVLYAYDVDAHRWVTPEVSGSVPEGRRYHSACVLGKIMYIFGGRDWKERTNAIYKLDTTTMVWSLINTRGTSPPVSIHKRHSATIIGTKMFICVGLVVEDNNISVFDTEINSWLNTPSAQFLPERCRSHAAFAYNGELYLFGGKDPARTFNVLWKFSPGVFSWKKVELKGKGPANSLCSCCIVGDRIIIFDDELYILDLSPSLKTLSKLAVLQYHLQQSELPHNIRLELAAMTRTKKIN